MSPDVTHLSVECGCSLSVSRPSCTLRACLRALSVDGWAVGASSWAGRREHLHDSSLKHTTPNMQQTTELQNITMQRTVFDLKYVRIRAY